MLLQLTLPGEAHRAERKTLPLLSTLVGRYSDERSESLSDRDIHPLPEQMDAWLLREWRAAWPDEDLTGIEKELFPPN